MRRALITAGLLLAAGLAPLAGCRGERTDAPPRRFFPDMDNQQRWDPQEATDFYADTRTARVTPEHAVPFMDASFDPVAYADEDWARGYLAEREAMLGADDAVYEGKRFADDGTETYLDTIPLRVTREMVAHGRDMFNIYCVACHGYEGDGKGMVGVRWAYPPANLTGEVYRDRANRQGKDGYLFDIVRNGLYAADGTNRMPGYGHALDEMDSWAVVAYIRALQKARGSSWDELTPEQQNELGRPAAAAEPGQPADAVAEATGASAAPATASGASEGGNS